MSLKSNTQPDHDGSSLHVVYRDQGQGMAPQAISRNVDAAESARFRETVNSESMGGAEAGGFQGMDGVTSNVTEMRRDVTLKPSPRSTMYAYVPPMAA